MSTGTVTAVRITEHGGIDRLTLVDLPAPTTRPGEVLVRVVASSINPVDCKTRAWTGMGPELPATLGWDLAGIVVESTVAEFATGDRVIAASAQVATARGTWAELVALPAQLLAAAPRSVSLAEAATLPLAGLTAAQGLEHLALPTGSRVLVIGAIGGVARLFVQLALLAGHEVDGVVSRAEHVAAGKELGLGTVVTELEELGPRRYDAVFDSAGVHPGDALVPGGPYLSISDDPLPDLPGARGMGIQEDGAGLARLADLVDAGSLQLRVAERFAVRDIRAAHERFEAGGLVGKVVIEF
jgi:NADPH:quinone reductase-like Zn-dependent oxidoreductase